MIEVGLCSSLPQSGNTDPWKEPIPCAVYTCTHKNLKPLYYPGHDLRHRLGPNSLIAEVALVCLNISLFNKSHHAAYENESLETSSGQKG